MIALGLPFHVHFSAILHAFIELTKVIHNSGKIYIVFYAIEEWIKVYKEQQRVVIFDLHNIQKSH